MICNFQNYIDFDNEHWGKKVIPLFPRKVYGHRNFPIFMKNTDLIQYGSCESSNTLIELEGNTLDVSNFN